MTCFDAFVISEAGRNIGHNHDTAAADADAGIFMVADGMGGRPGGAEASQAAVGAFMDALLSVPPGERASDERLREACIAANRAVRTISKTQPTLRGLGTTLLAAVLTAETGRLLHVGDSRALLLGEGGLRQLTRDHTLIEELVERNVLDADSAQRSPLRNVLSRVIGTQESVEPDIIDVTLEPSDWLVLATDGLAKAMTAERLAVVMEAAAATSAEAMCRAIMQAAMENPPPDNCTVVVVRRKGPESRG